MKVVRTSGSGYEHSSEPSDAASHLHIPLASRFELALTERIALYIIWDVRSKDASHTDTASDRFFELPDLFEQLLLPGLFLSHHPIRRLGDFRPDTLTPLMPAYHIGWIFATIRIDMPYPALCDSPIPIDKHCRKFKSAC